MKFQFEEALRQSRSGKPVFPPVDLTSPTIEEELEDAYDLALLKVNNVVLTQLLRLGQHLCRNNITPNRHLRNHRVGQFLWDYFCREPEALQYLCEVTINGIDRVSEKDRKMILLQRPARRPAPSPVSSCASTPESNVFDEDPSPAFDVLGQNNVTPGEMWQATQKDDDLIVFSPDSSDTIDDVSSINEPYISPFEPHVTNESTTPPAPSLAPTRQVVSRDPRRALKRSRVQHNSE